MYDTVNLLIDFFDFFQFYFVILIIFSIISVFFNVLRMLRYCKKWSILHKYHNIIRIISEHLPFFFLFFFFDTALFPYFKRSKCGLQQSCCLFPQTQYKGRTIRPLDKMAFSLQSPFVCMEFGLLGILRMYSQQCLKLKKHRYKFQKLGSHHYSKSNTRNIKVQSSSPSSILHISPHSLLVGTDFT